MAGTPGIERAHAVDEYVEVEHLAKLSDAIRRLISTLGH
jgi:acetylornithine deacetylase/succinyl-diaminopimelate desuccinylase-like protein